MCVIIELSKHDNSIFIMKGELNMSVRVGSARINEKGTINGGKAGDQTGNECGIQKWYLHSKGWVVIRAKDASVREKIAHNMESICNNNHIGYCQDHRSSLTTAAAKHNYDAAKVTENVETDCSEAVRNCCLYAGVRVGSFSTATELTTLLNTKEFEIKSDTPTCTSDKYLMRGDILVTRTKGHTVVVLDNGSAITTAPAKKQTVHTVVKGDNLTKIAKKYGTTVGKIVQDNIGTYPRMTANYIVIGWKLKIK